MCLDTRFKPEVEKKMIAKLPDGLITVYRWVRKYGRRYYAVWSELSFTSGLNHAVISTSDAVSKIEDNLYRPGYHSFKTQRGAKASPQAGRRGSMLIKAQMRKEWIGAIGKSARCHVYVTDRIISPSLRDKSAVVA